jgi:hypothetical protein
VSDSEVIDALPAADKCGTCASELALFSLIWRAR